MDWARSATLIALAAMSLTGCGFFKGITNPGAMWAMNEPSPMSLVVRRAELATGVADQVDRLLAETPIDEASRQALALTQSDAKALMETAAAEPIYAAAPGAPPFRVVPAEAWLPTLAGACAEDGEADTLMSLLGDEVAADYAEVASQGREIAALKGKIAAAEERADADGTSDADKKKIETEIAALEKQIETLDEDHAPKAEAMVKAVKAAAAKADDAEKKIMSPIVLNLLEAVGDARDANSAAMLRYPLAMPGMTDDLTAAAGRFTADVIEERTGHRPDTKGLSPQVELKGFDVDLTLNGVPADALKSLSMTDLVAEVTTRTSAYAGHALSLLAHASETEDRLAFHSELLEAWRDGLAAQPGAEGSVDISDLEVVSKPAVPTKPGEATKGERPTRSFGGLAVAVCSGAEPVIAKKAPKSDGKVAAKAPASKSAPKPKSAPPKNTAKRPVQGPTRNASSGPSDTTEWIDLPGDGGPVNP